MKIKMKIFILMLVGVLFGCKSSSNVFSPDDLEGKWRMAVSEKKGMRDVPIRFNIANDGTWVSYDDDSKTGEEERGRYLISGEKFIILTKRKNKEEKAFWKIINKDLMSFKIEKNDMFPKEEVIYLRKIK
jgi:hypothetical protein